MHKKAGLGEGLVRILWAALLGPQHLLGVCEGQACGRLGRARPQHPLIHERDGT